MELKLSKFDENIKEYIKHNTKGITRYCAQNSIIHLKKAIILISIDSNMAILRSITSEEEAVKALFMVLKQKQYLNSKKLKLNQHLYKLAVIPFLNAIGNFISNFSALDYFPFGENFNLYFDKQDDGKLRISFPYAGGILKPIPPLNFAIKKNGELYNFKKEFSEISKKLNNKDILKYLDEIASYRNRMLYAEDGGIPFIDSGIEEEIEKRKNNVLRIFKLICLIHPYKRSVFVQQALDSFINLMDQKSFKNLEY